ncbi:LysR substrate-binding domain-containing protein [Acidocella aminolytica]|uniref:Transcriptional regulator LysR n=1 Tax=Acidocella aminolytica 101 = DSM 11237 TaxID=1120923 RepID=A0A0D6PFG6_9PROT|nr:LysR substrate-binding domain-containing protein [Acidocella aminolytica]GAN79599.1 transcriptional regulator LysR [Acidocella aminolytica 101 = DSM 11237]GBQ37913.1 transcriptional regulator [Acidocella aminolytica 101 = DSM 11237]SHF55339.1 LysR family transcriptional regulator, glycine cleavage system transcriptional activator [Acidocella aminolytica 101 = DSM 11237]
MRFLTRLKSLQALEAAARHGSFVGAASELDVTPAAVGQLVRSLEDWVGYPLFRRARSGAERLTPTDEAREALEDIAQGLDRLEAGLRKLRGRKARAIVVVTASQALVANWLLGKLDDFAAKYPNIDVRLDVSDRVIDLAQGEADIGIRCGMGSWRGVKATRIMGEEIIAVCHHKLLPQDRQVTAGWIAGQTLIHDGTPHPNGDFPAWSEWLARLGVNHEGTGHGLRINSTAAVIQAAVAARGVALVRKALVEQEVESGRLVHLLPRHCWPVKWAYFAVASPKALRRSEVSAFHKWLVKSAVRLPEADGGS